jgi:hypothetical protein
MPPFRAAQGRDPRRLLPGRKFKPIIANGPVLRPLRTNLNARLGDRRDDGGLLPQHKRVGDVQPLPPPVGRLVERLRG